MKLVAMISVVFLVLVSSAILCHGQEEFDSTLVPCIPYFKKSTPNYLSLLLSHRSSGTAEDLVGFHLMTKENPDCTQAMFINDTISHTHTFFKPTRPTRIIIHGWRNNLYSKINDLLRSAYLTKGDFNVIIVDWGKISMDANYNHVAKQVDKVGKVVAEFVAFLNRSAGASYSDIYVIGHSLGAQVAGNAGYYSMTKFSVIFALDPAERQFQRASLDFRIDSSDAEYVESIQTNINLLGLKDPVGHAAFYPHHGQTQRGCSRKLKTCSHSRAYKYFAESINSEVGFWGSPCNSLSDILEQTRCNSYEPKVLMGGEPAVRKEGIFYVPTNKDEPFAVGPNYY